MAGSAQWQLGEISVSFPILILQTSKCWLVRNVYEGFNGIELGDCSLIQTQLYHQYFISWSKHIELENTTYYLAVSVSPSVRWWLCVMKAEVGASLRQMLQCFSAIGNSETTSEEKKSDFTSFSKAGTGECAVLSIANTNILFEGLFPFSLVMLSFIDSFILLHEGRSGHTSLFPLQWGKIYLCWAFKSMGSIATVWVPSASIF